MCLIVVMFFFKQKTAYEMRISDWSSDVCSSDLVHRREAHRQQRYLRPVPLGGGEPAGSVLMIGNGKPHRPPSDRHADIFALEIILDAVARPLAPHARLLDRKSTRLNSSH